MKKTYKKVLSMIILATFVAALTLGAFAIDLIDTHKEQYVYTIIGDSVPAGYGRVYDDDDNYQYKVFDESYPGIIRDSLYEEYGKENVKVNMKACAGMTSGILRNMLDSSYEFEDPNMGLMNDYTVKYNPYAQADLLREQILESDLITIQLGSNDIFTFPINNFLGAGEAKSSVYGALYKTLQEKAEDGSDAKNLYGTLASFDGLIGDIKFNYEQWTENMEYIIDTIRTLNQKATIVLVGMYNPFKNATLIKNTDITVGDIATGLLKTMDNKLKLWATQNGCVYADIWDTSSYYDYADYMVTDMDFWNNMLEDCHPTMNDIQETYNDYSQTGHEYIAECILTELGKITRVTVEIPENSEYVSATVDGLYAPIKYTPGETTAVVSVKGNYSHLLKVKAYEAVNDRTALESTTYRLAYRKGEYKVTKLFSIGKSSIGFKLDLSLIKTFLAR